MAELPGIRQEDVHLELQDGRLTISGVRREPESACEQYHRIERGHGTFSRTFHLQAPVDGDGITADLRDGVLTVTCPKTTDGPARRIQIT
jgi:HSP20 family protein